MRVLILLLCLFLIPCALSAQDSSLCEGQQYDVDGDNVVGVGDVLSVLSWFGTVLDADQDGTLDCNDDCVGVYDECGVCNGPGPQVQVLDTIIITYDSIYVEAINDWVTYELGADSVFTPNAKTPVISMPAATLSLWTVTAIQPSSSATSVGLQRTCGRRFTGTAM